MIAHHELYGGSNIAAIESALTEEPLAAVATQTIAAFSATTDLLTHVGNLAVDYGLGKPLGVFQSLLATYRALVGTQAALATTAESILATAEQIAADN
jgi:hypothetical protein